MLELPRGIYFEQNDMKTDGVPYNHTHIATSNTMVDKRTNSSVLLNGQNTIFHLIPQEYMIKQVLHLQTPIGLCSYSNNLCYSIIKSSMNHLMAICTILN